jgi:hypothetical protein
MNKSIIDGKEIRKFAITMFIALGILGSFLLWRKGQVGFVCWGIGLAILIFGLVWTRLLSPVYRAWMKLTLILGVISSHIVLAVMYYFVFTPFGLVMRSLGKDPLQKNIDKNEKSYWIKKDHKAIAKDQYEKMF